MRVADFGLLVVVCLIWAVSNVLGKIVVDHWHVPPVFFSAARFVVVAAIAFPWLFPMPRPRIRIVVIGLLLGGGNFALLYIGLQTVSPSAAAIVLQLSVPVTAILSVLILGERIKMRRGLGITLTFLGVVVATWSAKGVPLSTGLWFVLGTVMSASVGAILMKQMEDVSPLRFQAWVGLVSALVLSIVSAVMEQGQWSYALGMGWQFVAATLFMGVVVSLGAHSGYYYLISRYEANLIAPLTLITPLATIGLGILLTGDRFSLQMAIGAGLAMIGVLVVALVRAPTTKLLLEREER